MTAWPPPAGGTDTGASPARTMIPLRARSKRAFSSGVRPRSVPPDGVTLTAVRASAQSVSVIKAASAGLLGPPSAARSVVHASAGTAASRATSWRVVMAPSCSWVNGMCANTGCLKTMSTVQCTVRNLAESSVRSTERGQAKPQTEAAGQDWTGQAKPAGHSTASTAERAGPGVASAEMATEW